MLVNKFHEIFWRAPDAGAPAQKIMAKPIAECSEERVVVGERIEIRPIGRPRRIRGVLFLYYSARRAAALRRRIDASSRSAAPVAMASGRASSARIPKTDVGQLAAENAAATFAATSAKVTESPSTRSVEARSERKRFARLRAMSLPKRLRSQQDRSTANAYARSSCA